MPEKCSVFGYTVANHPTRHSTQVFVYGTLQPGAVNHYICADRVIEAVPAIAIGQLFALPFGYPAMTLGIQPIQGFVLSFADESILTVLDEFEQHDPGEFFYHAPEQILEHNQYERQKVAVFTPEGQPLGTAWAYLMTLVQVNRLGGIPLPNGLWNHPQTVKSPINECP